MTNTPKSLSREQLDALTCSNPDCTHEKHDGLFLHGACHPKSPQIVRFDLDDRALEITCMTCHAFVGLLALPLDYVAELAAAIGEREIERAREQKMRPGMRLRSQCHRNDGLYVMYQDGHLFVHCAKCQSQVQVIHVLERHAAAASA